MKRLAPLAALLAATLLGGCAVYPDGTPMYGNGYGAYSGYGYDGYGYAPGAAVAPQANVYLGYGNYGPDRYYGPGPGYRGYPDRGRPNNDDWHHGNRGDGGGPGQPRGGPPPQGAAGGPHGPGGMSGGPGGGPRPGAGGPPQAQQPAQPQAGGGGRGGGGGNAWVRNAPARQAGQMTEH